LTTISFGRVQEVMKLKVIWIGLASLFGLSETKSLSRRDDSEVIFFQEDSDEISNEERFEECAAKDAMMMPYYDSTCYLLTTRGPCMDGEWFVMDGGGDPTCKERECPHPNSVYVSQDEGCMAIGDRSTCLPNMELLPNLMGEGQCECIEGYGRLEGASDCHELLKQGPCADGQWLVLDQEGQVVCQDTTCLEDEYYFNGECVQMARTFDICKNGTQMAENFEGKGECEECSEECEGPLVLQDVRGVFDLPRKRTITVVDTKRKKRYAGGCDPLCIRRKLRRKRLRN